MSKRQTVADRSVSVVDLPPLSERLQYLTWLRLGCAGLVVFLNFWGASFTGLPPSEVLPATAIFITATLVNEFARKYLHRRGLPLLATMLIMDGIYLAWVMFATGGPTSPLRFLVYLHLIGVTLLASYRTGLKVALWHSLMFFVAFYAQLAGWVEPFVPIRGTVEAAAAEFNRLSVLNVVAFWFVAIGTAAFSATNERELRRNRDDMGRLAAMAVELEGVNEPRAVARVTLKRIAANFDGQRGAFVAGREAMSILAYDGEVPFSQITPHHDSLVLQAWRDRQIRLVRKVDALGNPMIASLFPQGQGLMIVPLFAESHSVGAIVIEYGEGVVSVERRVIAMIEQFASYAALALRNAWAVDEVKRLAQIDAMTGLANRGTFQDSIAREIARSGRSGDSFSLVLIDIDHFKKVNDTFGHLVGDQVIRNVASQIQQSKRPFDIAARFGGEEFAIILPGCLQSDAVTIAERFRATIAEIDDPMSVTGSVGIATYPAHGEDAESLIKAADEALYASKARGRDRVTMAGTEDVASSTSADGRVDEDLPLREIPTAAQPDLEEAIPPFQL